MNVTLVSEPGKHTPLPHFYANAQKRTGTRLDNRVEPGGQAPVAYHDPGPLIVERFLTEAEEVEILDNLS